MFIVIFICIFPLWYVLSLSLTNNNVVSSREVWFWPKAVTLNAYKAVFLNRMIISSFNITVLRSSIGAFGTVLFNACVAYGISKKYLVGRKSIMMYILITMYFSGGLIPMYLLLRDLELTNNFWGLVFPTMLNGWNIIIMKAFFQVIPQSLEESAKLDGANDILIFFRIVIPLSMPILATIGLFSAVFHWNDWFWGDLLMTSNKNIPLQTLLMKIIFQSQASMMSMNSNVSSALTMKSAPSSESIKMAAIIVSTVPILFVYPFLQKYFVKGIMIGSLKG
ncbi:MAG: carbohydrate ABC transporter permease [Bacteroidales bacterium]